MIKHNTKTFYTHNSLTRSKEPFIPADPKHIRIYACGPTVYSYAHIGNARMAVVCDLLARVLRQLYPRVTYASNITDIDDKIIQASHDSGESIQTITRKFERIYNEDMALLGVQKPNIQPRASEHIDDMIELIENLIKRGHAYESKGHVLYHVPSYKNYGALSGRSRDDQIAGARVEVAPFKRDPADFVLWKPSTKDQPAWASPWGSGRPGWHIECSAMSESNLGLPFDFHGGGVDLLFPHHENEIAQSCGSHGSQDPQSYARYWFHNGFVTVEGEKMSKSIGNICLVHDLVKEYPGETLRFVLLSTHYRKPLNWSVKTIEKAQKTLDRLYRTLKDLENIDTETETSDLPEDIMNALYDDLNTPKALAGLSQLIEIKDPVKRKASLVVTGKVLGILQQDPDQWLGYSVSNDGIEIDEINKLIKERQQARANKDYKKADEIRNHLKSYHIEIEDKSDGVSWRRANRN